MAKGRKPAPVEEWADSVSRFIKVDERTPQIDLAEASHLKPQQVARAVTWIRDEVPDLPLVSDRNGYMWTTEATTIRKYNNRRVRSAFTIIARLFHGVMKPWLKKLNHPDAARVELDFQRLLEDMERLKR